MLHLEGSAPVFLLCVIFHRNQNTRSAGRSSKALTETTTPSLTPPSYRTTTSGSFPEISYALVHCAHNGDAAMGKKTPTKITFRNTSLKPFLPRCGSWIGSFRKGCRSNGIWSWEWWRDAGGCQNAETWAQRENSILFLFESLVTKLPVFIVTLQRALTLRSGKL